MTSLKPISQKSTVTLSGLKIETLTERGSLREWLIDSVKEGQTHYAVDVETSGLGRQDCILSCAVTGPTSNDVAFFGVGLIGELMEAPEGITYVMHNASFDLKMLAWHGVPLHTKYNYQDTLILAHLADENSSHSLGDLVEEHFQDGYKKAFWAQFKKFEEADEESGKEYNAKDVSYTLRLYQLLTEALAAGGIPGSLVTHVHSLQRSLLSTEIAGIAVDRDYLMQKGVELKTRLADIVPKLRSLAPEEVERIEIEQWIKLIDKFKTPKHRAKVARPEFNWNSSDQLQDLIYRELKLPVQMGKPKPNKKTGRKNPPAPTLDAEALAVLKDLHPLCNELRYFRAFDKAYGTYVVGILDKLVDGRIYPSFNVTGTVTGRISHDNPNMGNMPSAKKAKELDEPFLAGLRGMFVPDAGHVLISADFAQLEICLSAHFTQDPQLLRIVNEGVSQHDITAEGLGIERSKAKTVNFGMQYGCSHFKVAKVLGVSNEKGKEAYDKYWETYSGQKRVMDECAAKVDRGEPITSPFGRRRRFELRKRQSWDSAYRQAWNALVQGTGSDCTSRAFYRADESLRNLGIGRALFTVHDEIVIQAKTEHAEEVQRILLEAMSAVGEEIGLSVKLKAEASGPMERWLD